MARAILPLMVNAVLPSAEPPVSTPGPVMATAPASKVPPVWVKPSAKLAVFSTSSEPPDITKWSLPTVSEWTALAPPLMVTV